MWFVQFRKLHSPSVVHRSSRSVHSIRETWMKSDNEDYTFGDMLDEMNFHYVITKPKCQFNNVLDNVTLPYFITLVHSYPSDIELRTAARDTWAHSDKRTNTFFLLGISMNMTQQQEIEKENSEYNDIIQGNFIDTHRNQTFKHFMALKWFTENCQNTQYLLKIDQKVYVNMPNVYNFLQQNNETEEFLMGIFVQTQETPRTGMNSVTESEYPPDYIPNYANKSTIIYSNDTAKDLYRNSLISKFFWIEDIFITGLVRSQINVAVTDLKPFLLNETHLEYMKGNSNRMPKPDNFMFSFTPITIEQQRFLWDRTEWNRMNIST